ncbi:MAG TPA: hypothetical protein PLB18_23640 [Acidobacteriota bacterium]|nr:hypothetical protein [Acidobacteriota bacterium]
MNIKNLKDGILILVLIAFLLKYLGYFEKNNVAFFLFGLHFIIDGIQLLIELQRKIKMSNIDQRIEGSQKNKMKSFLYILFKIIGGIIFIGYSFGIIQ